MVSALPLYFASREKEVGIAATVKAGVEVESIAGSGIVDYNQLAKLP